MNYMTLSSNIGSPEAWDQLGFVKDAIHKAAAEIHNVSCARGVYTFEEKLHWGLQALRAIRDSCLERVSNASVATDW